MEKRAATPRSVSIQGRSLHKGRAVLALGVAAVLSVLCVVQFRSQEARANRIMGLDLNGREGRLFIDQVVEGRPAERAGFQVGDRLVSANGVRVDSWVEYNRVAMKFRRGKPVSFLVERDGKALRLTGIPGIPFPWADFLGNLLIVAGYFALGLLALFQPVSDLSKRLLYLFAFAIALEFAMPVGRMDLDWMQFGADIAFYALTGLQFAFELHLVVKVPGPHPWTRRFPRLVPMIYLVGLGGTGLVALGYSADYFGFSLRPLTLQGLQWALDNVFLSGWSILLILMLGTQALRYPAPTGRHQAGFMLLGVLPWSLLVLYSTALSVLGQPQPTWLNLGWALTTFPFPIAVFIGMFRYHLFDLQLIVRKGLLYSALTGGSLLIFYAALGAGSFLLSRSLFGGQPSIWLIAGAALLLGLLVQPLRQGLQGFIDRRFFPERTILRQRLLTLVRELPVHGNLARMGEHLAGRLKEDFHAERVLVLTERGRSGALEVLAGAGAESPPDLSMPIPPEDEALQALVRGGRAVPADRLTLLTGAFPALLRREAIALAVPMKAESSLAGVILVGAKEEGERFRAEEVEMLDFVAQHVAVVFDNARLYSSATFDPLTGVLRREAALEKLEMEIRRAIRYNRPLTIGMADLDRFKQVNDSHGHLGGDQVLHGVAAALQEGLRGTDFLGRYGGDEFLLVFPETPIDQALEVAERVRERLEGMAIPVPGGRTVRLTVSLGLAGLAGMDTDEASILGTLLHDADNALYEAKQAGRNRSKVAGA